jgi:hypothetical protein
MIDEAFFGSIASFFPALGWLRRGASFNRADWKRAE